MVEKRNVWLPVVLLIVFAITRWPGLLPQNFSAVYALMFCAGVYIRHRLAWWVPLAVMAITDLLLNFYYVSKGFDAFQWYQLLNYIAYAAIFWLGRRFQPRSSFASLIGGGIVAALIFYFITNTAAWFFNPFRNLEYHHTLASWLLALTKGTGGWPDTWTFLRNTLFSSGLFTALFVGAMKYSQHLESAEEKKAANASAEQEDTEPEPDEAKAAS
jgi:hypothetical protein